MIPSLQQISVDFENSTYIVPVGPVVIYVRSSPMSLDKPKSAIFGSHFSSRSTLAGFKSK
jgi:hypothetical protein